MIAANDLRIGNLVEVGGEIMRVNEISRRLIEVKGTQDSIIHVIKDVNPIPITEEKLIKLGWLWNVDCNSFEKHPNGDARMHLTYKSVNGSWTMFNYVLKALIADKIFYIHQLQNLYYAFTNEELIIKL